MMGDTRTDAVTPPVMSRFRLWRFEFSYLAWI